MLPDEQIRAIKALHRHWLDQERAGNAGGILSLCTDDVIWIPAVGERLRGKAEIRAWLDQPQPRIEELRVSEPEVHGSGSFAYLLGQYAASYVPPGAREPQRARGVHLWILRKDPLDAWRVALVTWTAASSE